MGLRALIIEDESAARERLRTLCELEGDIEVVDCAESARQAIESMASCRPDLLFLDVQLRGSTAFEVLQALPEDHLPLVVFTTAYAEHAVAAFERAAIDYLLKPFSDERFHVAATRARERAGLLGQTSAQAAFKTKWLELLADIEGRSEPPAGQRLLGERQQRFFFLDPKDVESATADRNYVTLTAKGESYLARISMRQLEARLEGTGFVRIHKSLMINLEHVRHMERGPRGSFLITLRSGALLRSSPIYRQRILSRTHLDD
ncbi:MAG TPA: LytTR family DNA-binding domain-containing protein [Steroidobacteraceae bacterium]|jgi:two-component system LytT family response regulator|nr:LytTR family DNA-binding domain-containing protein [Steroidobacteraceae bacterium]